MILNLYTERFAGLLGYFDIFGAEVRLSAPLKMFRRYTKALSRRKLNGAEGFCASV